VIDQLFTGFTNCFLAIGYGFAGLERDDMKKIMLGDRECILHRESRYMLDDASIIFFKALYEVL
jgi:hypothetical protein